MSCDDEDLTAGDLFKEVRQMSGLLKSIKAGARDLLADENPESSKKSKFPMEDMKRAHATAAWARSTSKRAIDPRRPEPGKTSLATKDIGNVGHAEKYIKPAAPAYTFGSRSVPKFSTSDYCDDVGDVRTDYSIHLDAVSNHKRAQASSFGRSPRTTLFQQPQLDATKERERALVDAAVAANAPTDPAPVEGDRANSGTDMLGGAGVKTGIAEESTSNDIDAASDTPNPAAHQDSTAAGRTETARSYSFGKGQRFQPGRHEFRRDQSDEQVLLLDLDKASKALMPGSNAGAVMARSDTQREPYKPLPAPARATSPSHTAPSNANPGEEEKEGGDGDGSADKDATAARKTGALASTSTAGKLPVRVDDSSGPSPSLDALSYRPRTPAVAFRPEIKPFNKALVTKSADLGVPGPASYQAGREAIDKVLPNRSRPVGTIYREPSKSKNEQALLNKHRDEYENKANVGPCSYHAEESHRYMSSSQAAPRLQRRAESKQTPQLQRKRYFEQKARDLREVHDFQRPSTDSAVAPRVPVAMLAPPKTSRSVSADPKRRRIMREQQARRMQSPLRASVGAYTPVYAAVERRAPAGVSMRAETAARRSTSARIAAKRGVADRLAEKAAGNRASHKYYGPQLQTPWAVPFGSGGDGDGDDAGYSSPTDEVLQMLADRSAGVYSTQPRGEQAREKELAKAYAHAQQQLRHAPAARMAPPVPSERLFSAHQKRVPVEELQQSYLEPQLQHDWLGETALRDQRHKTPAVQMGRAPGRERVKVVQKGLAQVEGFADPVQPLQELGPGHYAQAERHLTVAEQTAAAGGGKGGKGVPFGKAISRQEQAGPYGEKPEAAVQSLGEALGEGREDLYFDDQLDIDYSRAKDQAQAVSTKQGFKMYIKERYPEPSAREKAEAAAAQDHLGGSWFEGMHEQALRGKTPGPVVDFERMTGRPRAAAGAGVGDSLEEEALAEVLGAPVEGSVDLQVRDWHPEQPAAKAYQMQDPQRYPRFPKESASSEAAAAAGEGAGLEPSRDPLFDLVRLRAPAPVDMSRMRGRQEDDTALQEQVLQTELGEDRIRSADAARVAAEHDAAMERGVAATLERPAKGGALQMDKQVSREQRLRVEDPAAYAAAVGMGGQKGREGAGTDEVGDLEGKEGSGDPLLWRPQDRSGKDTAGVRDWSKLPGREAPVAGRRQQHADQQEEELLAELGGPHREELDIDASAAREASSRHKRAPSAPDWGLQSEGDRAWQAQLDLAKGGALLLDGEERALLDPTAPGRALDLDDVDPGAFKVGLQPIGAGESGGPSMAQQLGRAQAQALGDGADGAAAIATAAGERRELQELGIEPEQLDLRPDPDALKPHPSGAVIAKAGRLPTHAERRTEQRLRDCHELIDGVNADGVRVDSRPLQLEASTEVLQAKVPGIGGVAMRNAGDAEVRASVQEERVLREIRRAQQEELQLDPSDRATRKVVRGGASAVMKDRTQQRPATPAETAAELRAAGLALDEEGLLLDTKAAADAARGNRVKGGSALASTGEAGRSSRLERQVAFEVDRASTEQLDLRPVASADPAVKTSAPRAASLASREPRLRSSTEQAAEQAFLRQSQEELVLERTDALRKPPRNASAASLGSKTVRFQSAGEARAEAALDSDLHLGRREGGRELQLDTANDAAMRRSVPGGASMGGGRGGGNQQGPRSATESGRVATGNAGAASDTASKSPATTSNAGRAGSAVRVKATGEPSSSTRSSKPSQVDPSKPAAAGTKKIASNKTKTAGAGGKAAAPTTISSSEAAAAAKLKPAAQRGVSGKSSGGSRSSTPSRSTSRVSAAPVAAPAAAPASERGSLRSGSAGRSRPGSSASTKGARKAASSSTTASSIGNGGGGGGGGGGSGVSAPLSLSLAEEPTPPQVSAHIPAQGRAPHLGKAEAFYENMSPGRVLSEIDKQMQQLEV